MADCNYVLSMKNISKDYFGNKVLKGINLDVKPGEIHALLGENGAGKSTLMNILFGMPVIHSTGGFEGEIFISGEKIEIKSPHKAMELGIGMVHQEFMLIPGFTVTENIKINREILKPNLFSRMLGPKLKGLDYGVMNLDARQALDTIGISIEEYAKVSGMPVGYMQFIEIAREVDKKGIKLMVFDEPTAVLTESEAETLLQSMKKIASTGIAIIFITHRLDEVISVADRITILRDGEMVAVKDGNKTNVTELAELMVGRKVDRMEAVDEKTVEHNKTIMEIKNLRVLMPGEEVKGVDLEIKEGEILGIGGLAGQGKIGIANGIMGLYYSEGEVIFNGTPLKLNDPKEALNNGLAFVSEDRRGVGLLLDTPIELNIALTAMQIKNKFLKKYLFVNQMDKRKIRQHSLKMIKDLDIRCRGPQQITRRLSGGNQQKVCIARALTMEPKVLFVSEPTRGIDIGAKKLILDFLVRLNKDHGMTIVMTSSELGELRSVTNRIAIVSEGKIEGILKPTDSDAEFGLMMAGYYSKQRKREGA